MRECGVGVYECQRVWMCVRECVCVCVFVCVSVGVRERGLTVRLTFIAET